MHPARVSWVVSLGLLIAMGTSSIAAAGCVVHPWGRGFVTIGGDARADVVTQRPPLSQATIYAVGAAPYEGAQWVQAHWEWSGGAYVWMSGYWIRPSEQYAFVQPRWESRDGGYVYVEGGWSNGAGMIVVPASRARDYDESRARVVVAAPRPTATVYVAPPTREDRERGAGGGPVVVGAPHGERDRGRGRGRGRPE